MKKLSLFALHQKTGRILGQSCFKRGYNETTVRAWMFDRPWIDDFDQISNGWESHLEELDREDSVVSLVRFPIVNLGLEFNPFLVG